MIEFLEKFMGKMGLIRKSLTRSSRTRPPLVKHHVHQNQLAPERADIALFWELLSKHGAAGAPSCWAGWAIRENIDANLFFFRKRLE